MQRVPSARDLFAKDLRKELPLYSNRRVRRKQSFWSLQTLQARFRDLCDKDMAMWKARANKAKKDRERLVRDRSTGTCGVGPTPDVPVAPSSGSNVVEGSTATWLRLDCSVEPPGDASEVAEDEASVDMEVERIQWVDDLGCDIRSLRRLPKKFGALGQGSYGCCYVFEDEVTGEYFCAKLQKTAEDSEGARALQNELRIMNACNHPNVLRGFALVLCRGIQRHALLMPKCDCDLKAWLVSSSASAVAESCDEQIRRERSGLLVQLCRGYSHLHGAGYLHLDVKPENVVVQHASGIEKVRVCVADFGISREWRVIGSSKTTYALASSIQCELYRPWDLFHAAQGRVPLRPRLDIWAFGCLVYDVCYMHSRSRGDSRSTARLFTGIPMTLPYDSVMASRNYRLRAHLRPLEVALVVRCQDLRDPRRNHTRMEELLSCCRGVAAV